MAVSSITSIVTMSVAQSISELLDLSIEAPVVGMFGIGIATYLVGLAASEGVSSIRKLRENITYQIK